MKRIPYVVFCMFLLTGVSGGCGDDADPKDPVDAAIPDADTPDADVEDGAVEPGEKPLGSWMNVFDEPVLGPGDISSEAVVADIGESEIVMVFYRETVQVTGARGLYEMEEGEENSFLVTLTHLWEAEEMDWVELAEPFEKVHPYTFDETTLVAMSPEGDEIPMTKTEFVQSTDLVGEWYYTDGINEATMILSNDWTHSYEQEGDDFGEYSEEGVWSSTGEDAGYLRTSATTVNDVSPVLIEALTGYELTENGGEQSLILYYPDGEGGLFPVSFHRVDMRF